jgi:hypothetical protein
MRKLTGVLVAILLFAVAGYAQTFRGGINGTVNDPTGAVVAGAEVKATNNATGIALTSTTTTGGEFSFQDLPLGSYKISVTAAGFGAVTVNNVSVTAGGVYTLPVTLKVGSSATQVEVSAEALSLDTTTATQSNIIPTEQVANVPMNGRDFTQFAAVQPGYGGYSVGGFGSLNGTRANQMNWQIDGVDNNDFWHNIPAVNQGGVSGIAGVVMPLDAIDEFAAQTQSAAEGGRNAGGIVNVVLKSGTNQLHGSLYYFNRNTSLGAATPFFNPSALAAQGLPSKKPPLRNENYGFSIGGPIFKDKTFWFVTFEKQKYTIGLSGQATEPSLAYQSNALALLTAGGVTESPISAALISTLWPSLINNLPAKQGNYFATNPSIGYSYNGLIKLDHNFSDKHHFSIRWYGGQGDQIAPLGGSAALATASSNLPYYFEKAPIHVYNYAATLNSAFSSRVTNQLLFGVNYFNQVFNDANHSFNTFADGLNLSPDALIHGKPILGAPNLQIAGFEQVGLSPPQGRNDITGMLADIVSYNVGKHQFRFGGEVRQGRVDEFYFRHSLGKFGFTGKYSTANDINGNPIPGNPWYGTCTGGDPTCALADFLAGDVSGSSIAVGNAERKVKVNGLDFFMQDAWQVTRKLNINWGVRWDYYGPLHSDAKDLAVFIPEAGGIKIQGNGIGQIFPSDKNNFAPRFGFSYQPTDKADLVIRGGFGVFYDQINMNPFLDFRPPNNADGLEDNPAGPSPVSAYSTNYLGAASYNWETVEGPSHAQSIFNGVQLCPTGNGCTGGPFDVFSVNQNFRTPYFYNYNFNVQKSFGNGMAVWQVGYVGSEGRKLSVMLNINQFGQLNAQFPNYGGINQLNSIGTSNYNALQSTLRLRAWHGLSSQFAYTWAHALDEITAYRGALPFDSRNLKGEYGNGDFDTRHNFSATLVWDIPGSSRGPKWLSHGWSVNSLMTFHGGQPLDQVRAGVDIIGNPFAGVSHSFSKSLPGVQWINPLAFCTNAATVGVLNATCPGLNHVGSGVFGGDLRRNQIYGPGFSDVDMSVIKNFSITERMKAQFRFEMFNLFNRINLASGVGATTPGFGAIQDTIGDFNGAPGLGPGEAFNINLGAKIIF